MDEAAFLHRRGILWEIVPGSASTWAASACAGMDSTDTGRVSAVILIAGHGTTEERCADIDWDWVAQAPRATIVLSAEPQDTAWIADRLIGGGMAPDTPASAGPLPDPSPRLITGTLADIADAVRRNRVTAPLGLHLGACAEPPSPRPEEDLRRPLRGLRILVTRAADQAAPMSRRLRELGARVLALPTIATRAHFDPAAWERFEACTAERRWLVFTSENGVRHFSQQHRDRGLDVRGLAAFRVAAVGSGTAEALRALSLLPDFVPGQATGSDLAKELAAHTDLRGAAVVRVRGNLASATPDAALAAAGAELIPMTVYETVHVVWPPGLKEMLAAAPPDAAIFTSGSGVDGLYANLTGEEISRIIAPGLVVSIGPSTSEAARARGLTVGLEAARHAIPDLIDELTEFVQTHPIRRT